MVAESRKQKNRQWKGVFRLFLVLALILGCQSAVKVQAADPGSAQQKAKTGTLGENGGITWSYSAAKKTLTVSGEDELHGSVDSVHKVYSPFKAICAENQVERIVFRKCKLRGNADGLFAELSDIKELDLSGLNTGNVTDMGRMFYGCSGLRSLDVSRLKTENVTDMECMFYGCSGLSSLDLSGLNTGKVTCMSWMFCGCRGLQSLDVSGLNTGNVTNIDYMFRDCSSLQSLDVSGLNMGNLTDMHGMFYGCSGLKSLNVSKCNTKNVQDMSWIFYGCSGLTSLDVTKLDTGNVRDMECMFYGCSGLTSLDVSKFDTGNVTDMSWMFHDCSGLTSLDVSKFDTRNVTDMSKMFYGCSGLKSLDLSGFDTGYVLDMDLMFRDCSSLQSLDLSGFDTGNVRDMHYMFYGCSGLQSLDVSKFDTGNVTDMQWMFGYCSGLKSLDISGFEIGSEAKTGAMFYDCTPPVLKTPKTVAQEIRLYAPYRDAAGKVYKALTAENTGKELKRADDLITYEIWFDGNGSTGGSTAKLTGCKIGKSYTLPANKFKRTGYTFAGWNTEKDGSGTTYKDKASVKDLAKKDGAVVILYAQWKINRYSIAFKGNGATEGTMKTLEKRKVGTSYTLPANKFKRTGYTFTGWNTKKDGSGTTYKNKASVKDLSKKNGATVTLYAQWKKNSTVTYQIKFNGNGGTGKMSALKCKTGKSYQLPANAFKKQGYTFAGWNTKKDGTGKSFKNKASVKDLTKKSGATVTLYAQWKPNTYTVKFDGNKATGGKMKDIENCQYDKSFKLTKSAYKRKGYTFAGWNTKKNGTGKSYKNGAQVKNLTAKNKGTVVLYAQWIKKK